MKLNYTFNDCNLDVNIEVIHLSKVILNVTFCSYFSFCLPTFTGCPAQLSGLAARDLQMLTAIEELNSKLSTVLSNQRVILRHLQVAASGDISGGIILPLTSTSN